MANVYVIQKNDRSVIPNSEDWEKKYHAHLIYLDTDHDIHFEFAQKRPDVIITVSDPDKSFEDFVKLCELPLYIRRRWVALVGTKEDIDPQRYIVTPFEASLANPWGSLRCKDRPRVSVFCPSYESGDRIVRALHSLRAQTMPEWEFIIIDDSKTDHTWHTSLMECLKLDCRVRMYRGQFNNGYIGCLKRDAARLGVGEFLMEMDHDDEMLPETLQMHCDAYDANPEVGCIGGYNTEIYEDTLENWSYGQDIAYGFGGYVKVWYQGRYVNVQCASVLNKYTLRHIVGISNHPRSFRTECYNDVGGHDSRLNVSDDFDLWIRIFVSERRWRCARIPRFMYVQYRTYSGSNFTVQRNSFIQYVVKYLRTRDAQAVRNRLLEYGMDDNGVDSSGNYKNPSCPSFYNATWDPSADLMLEPNPEAISIILPTFKRTHLLKLAIQSVFAQTFTNWKLYIIGDCCDQLDEFMNAEEWLHEPRVQYWNLEQPMKHGSHARNYALKHLAHTEFIAYLDDDNTWTPDHLETLYRAINTPIEDPDTSHLILPQFAFSSFVTSDGFAVLASIPGFGRVDSSSFLQRKRLFEVYDGWYDEATVGYAVDYHLVNRWVEGNEPYRATGCFTLYYTNTNQDMEYILNYHNDQRKEDYDAAETRKKHWQKTLIDHYHLNSTFDHKVKPKPRPKKTLSLGTRQAFKGITLNKPEPIQSTVSLGIPYKVQHINALKECDQPFSVTQYQ